MHELRVDEGEAGELGLVDVGDDQLVGRRELRLGAGEELVEVLGTFAALETRVERQETGRIRLKVNEKKKKITKRACRLTEQSRKSGAPRGNAANAFCRVH